MKTKELVTEIVKTRDSRRAFRLADEMSAKYSMTAAELYEFVNRIAPIPAPEWDELVRDGESSATTRRLQTRYGVPIPCDASGRPQPDQPWRYVR